MLRAALSSRYGGSAAAEQLLTAAGIDATLRGEALAISDFVAIARYESTQKEIAVGS